MKNKRSEPVVLDATILKPCKQRGHKQMTQVHDIFLRAYAVVADKEKKRKAKRKRGPHANDDPKWSEHALVFDTETRITADQSLTFGVYRLCKLVDGNYTVIEEGIFYSDDPPKKERKALEAYMRSAIPDVASFPPQFPLYTRSEFMKRVFWPAIKKKGAIVVGFNLPFDLARLALDWSRGEKGEWSLTLSKFPDGNDNKYRPRVSIQPIDSKKAFISLASGGNIRSGKITARHIFSICARSDGPYSINRFRSRPFARNSKPSIRN